MLKPDNIKLLDCTLRDGGYVNNWHFGYKNIKNIIQNLTEAKIDYVECGFFKPAQYNRDFSIFSNTNEIYDLIQKKESQTKYTLMINYGEYNINQIQPSDNSDIIFRVVFNKENITEALDYCKKLQEKGYNIFINPKSTNTYTKEELYGLIMEVNKINPIGFTVVDTTGSLTNNDVTEIFDFVNQNLNKNIELCFHFHDNLKLSFSNAKTLIESKKERKIIIDSTVSGIGRGAGNLQSEIITEYLNRNYNKKYNLNLIKKIAKDPVEQIFSEQPWGYSLPYYYSALNRCHPNYAKFLSDKNILSKDINKILQTIPKDKRTRYDKVLIEQLQNSFDLSSN